MFSNHLDSGDQPSRVDYHNVFQGTSANQEELCRLFRGRLRNHPDRNGANCVQNHITGRLPAVIPFMPFSTDEAAVVAHKFILSLKNQLRQPIDVEERCLYRHIKLDLRRDGDLCSHLAKEGYDMHFGTRPLARTVNSTIRKQIAHIYEGKPKVIENVDNNNPPERYIVELHRDKESDDIAVFQYSSE